MSRRDIRKPLSFLLFLLLLGGAQTGWGQSLIPSTPGNYLQVTGSAATGDNDTFMVVFFSVPDDTSGPLYFAIDDPYLSGTSPDDGTDTAGGDSWDFYLVGGSGTFSSPISRQVTFGDIGEAANGSTLEELKFDGDGGGDNGWHYFSGVSPTQGEHIGNQYYFKVVAEAPNTDKNAFRLNVSKTDSGDPTGIAGVRAFAYAWTLALLNNTGRTWELYPFVPDSATGNITAFFVDFDNQDQGSVYNKTDRTTALASNLGNAATDSYSTAVTGQTNGTWYVELTETNGFPAINTALFYAEGSSPAEAYRVYASDYFPAAPDHVSATAEDGSAISNGSDLERVLLQLVDDSGDAVPYVRNIYLSVDGSAEIEATSDEAGLLNATERVVTTDSEGFAWVDVSDTVAENVTLTVITDGTTGVASQSLTSSRLPSSGSLGVNDAPQLSFIADAYPTASSAFGTSFIEGATQAIAAITIAEAGSFPSITAADGIRITIPTSKDVTFNTTPSSLSLSVSNGGGTVSYDNSNKTAVINVDTDFGTIDSLTVSGLELTAAADSDTSFFLEFSFDGDLVAEVSDNKLIIVQDTASTYTWTGSNTTWADQTNWDSGDGTAGDDGYPGESVITDNVVIPGGLSNYPVLASAVTINDLSIGSGGELDIGSTVLTVNGDSSNDGRLILSGAAGQGTGLGSFDTDSGTIEYSGGGSVQLDNCYNIEFSSGTYTLASDLTVKGDMTISGATVEDGGQAISISGDWNLSSGTFSANSDSGGTGTVEFVGSSIASLSGDTSFYNLTVQRAGKIIKFGAGDAFTVDGTLYVVGVAGNLINLISSNPETQWTITNGGGSETVQYVEVEDSAVGGTNDIAAYYSIDGDRNDTTSPGWNFFGTAWTWTGSISSAWGDEGNWDSGDESAGNDGTPGAGDSVTIPFTSRDPQLTGAVTVDDLTIEAWVEFDLNDYDLTVSGTLTNVGTLRAEGGGSVTASLNTDSGSVEYYGTGSYSHLAFGNSYYDLTISGGGSYALGAALTVENDLTVSSGTLDASGGADLLLGGDVDFSGGTFSKGTGTFTLQAADAQSLDPNAQDLGAFLVAGSGTAVTPSGDLIVDSLTIDSGASLTIGTGISIDVGSGALTNAGTLISSGAITAGDFSSTGTFTNAAANTISASGDVVISGSFGGTSTDNTLTMSGDGTRLDASENLGNLSVDPGSGNTVSLANNALVLDGDLAINSGSLNVEGFGITVSGSFSNSDTLGFAGGESTVSLPSSPIPGTVHYYGNSNTTGLVGGNSYTDLLFENSVDATSVTWTLSADLSVSDTLTVGSSTTLSTSTAWNNVTVSGDVDVSSGTFDAGGSGTIKVGGDVSFGTLTGGSGSTLELDGSSAQAIVPNGQSFGAVSLSGSGGVTLSGTGSFQSLTIAGGESLTLGGGAVTTGLTVNGTVTNGGSLYLNSDDAGGPTSLYMADGTTIANSGVLQVVSSTGAVELSSPGTTTLTGNELDVNGESLNLGGFETAIDHTLGAGDAVTLVGDVSFSGTLTLNGTGASLTTGDNTLTTGSLTITEGTVAVSGSGDVDVGSGAVTVGASGELTFNTTGSPALISGDFTSSGTVNNSQTSLVRASGNVEIDGSFGTPANSTVEMSGASATINTVVQAGSLETSGSAGVSAVTSNLKLAGDLTIALGTSVDLVALGCSIGGDVSGGGTLDGGSGSVDVNGDFTVGSYDATSGTTSIAGTTVSFTSLTHNSGEIDLDGTGTPVALSTGGQGLYSLTISNGSGFETVNVSGSLNLAGDLDIATGHTLGMGNNVLSVSGSTTNGGAITGGSGLVSFSGAVSGTGTITSGTGGVSFEGNYSGGVLVGNAAGTITFEGASTTLGTFTPNGTSVLFSGTATPQVFDPNANTLDGDVSINKDLQASILRLAGDLTLQDVSMTIVVGTLDLNAHTLTLNDSTGSAGNITLDSAGGLDMSTSGSALELQGDWSSDSASAFDPGSETVTFSGDHNPQSLASGGKSFYSITVTKDAAGDTLQLSDNLTQNAGGVLTVTTGELDLDGNTLTLGADLSLNSSDGTVTVVSGSLDGGSSYDVTVAGGSITHTTGSIGVLDFTVSGGTVTIGTGAFTVAAMSVTGGSFTQTGDNGGNTQSVDSLSVTGGSCSWDSGSAGGTLVFTGAPGADLTESSGSLSFGAKTVTGIEDIYITGGDLDLGTAALTSAGGGAGTYTINTSGTITDSGSTLTLNGDGTLSLDDDESIGDLVIGAAITFSDGGADPDVDTLSFSGGSLAVGGNAFRANSADVSGAVTVGNGGSFGTVGALTVNNGGSITASGSGIVTAGAVLTMNGTGTVSVEDGTMSVSAGGAALNGSGALSSSGAGNIDVTGNLVWTGASSDVSLSGGGQLLVSGNLTQDGSSTGEISVGAGGIAVNGDLSQAAAGNGNISAGAGGVSVGGVLTMYSTLSVTGGDIAVTGTGASGNNGTIETITSGSQSYAGTFTNSGTLTGVGAVSFGSDLINSGTLNMGSGIVSVLGALDGSGGTIDFNGTNDGELEVSADVTFTSGSSITNGDSGDVIRFTGAGAQLVRSGGHAFPSVEVNKSGGSLGLDTDNMTQATGATLSFGCSGATAVNLNGLSWTLEAAVDINDNVGFNVLAGTLDGGQALTVSGTGDLIHTSGRVEVSSYTHSGTGSSLFGVGDIAISGQLEVSDGSFTQTGDNGGNTQSVDSLSVTGGSCSWDSGSAGGTLVFTGAPGADLTESSGSLFFGAKTVTGIEDIYITGGNLDLGTAALTSAGGGAGIYTINTSGTITDLGSTLTLNGTGALTLDDDESIGALVIGADITFIDGGMDPDVNTLTVGSGSSLSCGASDFSTSGDAVLNGNLSFSDGNFIAGGNLTLSSGGTLDVSGAGAVTVTGTTIAAGTVVIGGGGVTLVGDADLSGATIDFGPSVDRVLECQRDLVCSSATSLDNSDSSDTLIFSGEVEQNLTSAGLSLMSVSVESSGLSLTRVVPLDDTTIDGDLSVTADAEFSTGGNDVTLSGAMSLEGLTYPDCGVFELDGRETVSIGTMDIDSGIVRFVGDLTASGAVSATVYDLDDPSSDPANFYILELNATNSGTTFTLVKNTEIASEVRVLQGSFDLGGYDLSIGGSAPGSLYVASGVSLSVSDGNLTADGDVECDGTISLSGTVVLTAGEDIFGTGTLDAGSSADSVEINVGQDFDITTFNPGESTIAFNDDTIQESHIGRAYTFYNLEIVDTNGDNDDTPKIVYFPEGELITIAAGGSLVVTGAENHEVELLSSYTESNSHPATAYDDALYSEQWRLTIEAGGTADIDNAYVELSYSYVPIYPTSALFRPDRHSEDDWCYNWRLVIPVIESLMQDSNGDGKLDRIQVTVNASTPLNDDFSDFSATVDGYTVAGYDTGTSYDDVFYILLEEKPYLDTDATPSWWITGGNDTNDSLRSTTGTSRYVTIEDTDDIAATIDSASPVIGYTLAVSGYSKVFIHFSEPVQVDSSASSWIAGDFTVNGTSATSLSIVTGSSAEIEEVTLNTASALSDANIIGHVTVTLPTTTQDAEGNIIGSTTHRVSDLGLGIIEPVYARNTAVQRDATRGAGVGLINYFDDSAWLEPQEIELQVNYGSASVPTLSYDSDVPQDFTSSDNSGLWLPSFDETDFSGLVPYPNDPSATLPSGYSSSDPASLSGADQGSSLINFTISDSSDKLKDNGTFDFFLYADDLYHARVASPAASNWYRTIRPFSFEMREVRTQTGDVTILNNVINPDEGEKTTLHYTITRSGTITIQVFNLAGDLIDVLYRGRRSAGEYAVSWDGRNRAGYAVGRGIYFVRFSGPGIDEYRKVMVIR